MTIWTIASNTFKEGIRARILYTLVFFAILMMFFSYLLGQLALGENVKVMEDVGLSAISLFGMLIAVFVGIGLIYKELEKRTIYTIIAKPIRRSAFILGKYAGLALILAVQLVAMMLVFLLVTYFFSHQWHAGLLIAGLYIYLELLIITAVAIFFSSFSSPFLSALFTISFYIIGHSTEELAQFASKGGSPLWQGFTQLFSTAINLDYFNLITEVVHGLPITPNFILQSLIYAAALITLLLTGSIIAFSQRDFK